MSRNEHAEETEVRLEPCVLTTPCMPWREDCTLAEDILRREVRRLLNDGFENLYIFGTAGEGYAVTDDMFRQAAAIFHEEMQASKGLRQLGVIAMSVPQVKARIDMGLETGFRMFQISLPPWGAVNDREMYGFFDAVLGAYPAATFMHYNISRGRRVITAAEYAKIAAAHPNLVAIKHGLASPRETVNLLTRAPELCHFFTELGYAYASLLGRCGLLVSVSIIAPAAARELFAAGQRQDARALARMTITWSKVLELVMECAASGQHMDGAYDKLFAKLADPDFPLRLLPPYQGSTDEEFRHFAAKIREHWPGEAG